MTRSSPPAEPRRRRPWGGWAAAIVAAVTVAAPAAADLTPPALTGATYTAELLAVLGAELDHFARIERGADPGQQVVIRASINLRIIAAELLELGDGAGADGSAAVERGLQIAHGRAALDDVLIGALRGAATEGADRAALDAVARFNELAVDRAASLRTVDALALDRALPGVFGPLAEAATLVTGTAVVSHWPRGDVRDPTAPAPSLGDLDALQVRIDGAAVGDDTRAAFAEILTYLRRGERFPELTSAVRAGRTTLTRALDFADAAAASTLLDDATRGHVSDRLHAALQDYRTPERRGAGAAALDRLERLAWLLRTAAALPEDRGLAPLGAAVSAVAARDDGGAATARAVDRLTAVVERMVAFRALDAPPVSRDVRAAWARVRGQHETAERGLVRDVGRLADDPHALADPAFAAGLKAHRVTLDDLRRLARLPRWRERMREILPRSPGFQGQVRRWAQDLADAQRRERAAETMDRFEGELTRFTSVPFEADLAAASPPAIVATGGLHAELRRALDAGRRAWAEGWNRGDPEASSAWMDRLARLAEVMADGVALLENDDDTLAVGRWAAWETHRGLLQRVAAELPNRLKLATAAAVATDAPALDAQLARLEAEGPLPALVGRLSRRLAPALAACPGGAAGRLGVLVHPPPDDAWLGERRAEVAELCRYVIELEAARAIGSADPALEAFVDDRARALLEVVGAAPAPRPPSEP